MPSLAVLISMCVLLFVSLFLMLRQAIANARKEAELEKEIEDEREANDLQKDYNIIGSRPSASARSLIDRMRNTPPANQ